MATVTLRSGLRLWTGLLAAGWMPLVWINSPRTECRASDTRSKTCVCPDGLMFTTYSCFFVVESDLGAVLGTLRIDSLLHQTNLAHALRAILLKVTLALKAIFLRQVSWLETVKHSPD